MKNGKFGFGIIGCGAISPWHAKGIEVSDKAELVAVCDIVPERVKKICEDHANKPTPYSDYRDLIADPRVDIVCVCTPSGNHGEIAIAAAQAGKHILCEKPLEIKLDKIDRMIQAAENNKVKLGCVFQRRTYESSRKVREAVQSGKLGKMVLGDVYLKYYRSQAYYDSGDWRGTWELDGGGALMNQGIHGIDLLLWVMGDVDTVYARTRTMVRNIEVEDTATAMLQYKNGAMGIVEATTSVNPGEPTRLEFNGKLGSIIYEESRVRKWAIAQGEDERAEEIELESEEEQIGGVADPKDIGFAGHIKHIADIIDAVENDRDPLVTAESARKPVELILAMYESSRQNKEIKLPL